ncbi:signal peptide containing protein [Theileria equi strain WA]|uniref:Signal peptide containing protein n=1 Tax=Theileria equi strain WA TaxID=1537102 RepID=L1LAF3_THEEQ|nr:signal peptide containing protein [Theileria equi strain WA]EKX72239.1 signal peptide containing protein [Theileria equi strain WA]|eukprot:XP_004831691.1 signal peptide containing protein [Theileria equi strain WA]
MRILAVLWTLYLVRLCHCGGDEDGKKPSTSGENPSTPKETPQGATSTSMGAQGPKVVSKDAKGKHKSVTEKPKIKLSIKVIDLEKLDFKSFDIYECNDNGNEVSLVVPKPGVVVSRVIEGETTIWVPYFDEKLDHFKIFYRFGQVKLALLAYRKGEFATGIWFEKVKDDWFDCTGKHSAKVLALKVPIERRRTFVIDLEDKDDTKQCRIFTARLFGIDVRFYHAKFGYIAREVMYQSVTLWDISQEENEMCFSCNLYYKEKKPYLLVIMINKRDKLKYKCFERVDDEWKPLTLDKFKEARGILMGFPFTTKSKIEQKTKTWWTRTLERLSTRERGSILRREHKTRGPKN